MWNEPDFRLAELHPAAQLVVMLDVKSGDSGFTSGNGLREHWESSDLQRVHQLATPPSSGEEPWRRCLCPDGSTLFVKFLSPDNRLLDGAQLKLPEQSNPDPMPTPPPAKKAAPPKKSTTPATKPVAAPKTNAKTKVVKEPKAPGNTPWLHDRLCAQTTATGSPLAIEDASRSNVKAGLKSSKTFTGAVAFLERSSVIGESKIDPKLGAFLDFFFGATINRPNKKD